MTLQRAVCYSDFTPDREWTRLLCSVPKEAPTGQFLRAVHVMADQIAGDPGHHWTLYIVRLVPGPVAILRALPFAEGFPVGSQRIPLDPEIGVDRGDTLALRVTPSSNEAPPLTGLSVIPETAISGARAR